MTFWLGSPGWVTGMKRPSQPGTIGPFPCSVHMTQDNGSITYVPNACGDDAMQAN